MGTNDEQSCVSALDRMNVKPMDRFGAKLVLSTAETRTFLTSSTGFKH